ESWLAALRAAAQHCAWSGRSDGVARFDRADRLLLRFGGAMKRARELLTEHGDRLIALGLFAGYLVLLLATAGSLGFMRDEGFYFASARAYGAWFELLFERPSEALTRAVIDRYWAVNHEHPSLIKSLFALSNLWLGGLFDQASTSFRLPGMLF